MKTKKIFYSLLAFAFTTLTLNSCSPSCSHQWTNYIAKNPACETTGIMERLCEICGKKVFEEITPTGHQYKDNTCTICGAVGDGVGMPLKQINLPANSPTDNIWNFELIYEKMLELSPEYYTYNEFLDILSSGYLQDIYINELNLLHFSGIESQPDEEANEFSLMLPISKAPLNNPATHNYKYLMRVDLQDGLMHLTYSDGVQISAGHIAPTDDINIDTQYAIKAFGINNENEFIIYYKNNTVSFAGHISTGKAPENQSTFLYTRVTDGYAIHGVCNNTLLSHIEIPLTHRGLPIVEIRDRAFYNAKNLKSVIIGENVKTLGSMLFRYCDSLEYIVIPKSVTFENIQTDTFEQILANPKIFFNCNDLPLVSASTLLNIDGYYLGEWSYQNGIPTPNK